MVIKKSVSFCTVALLCLLLATQVFAQKDQRAGTAGAQELLIPVGSVGSALGGANLAITQGSEAIYWNPAGAAILANSSEVMVSTLNWIGGIDIAYAGGLFKAGNLGVFGLSIKTVSFGDIQVTTNDAPDGTGVNFSPDYVTAVLTYSRQMTDRINIGTNAKMVGETIGRESARGFAFDFGVQYNTPLGVGFGIALKNIGPNMKFSGGDLEIATTDYSDRPDAEAKNHRIELASYELPTSLEIGVSYDASFNEQNSLTVMGAFLNNNFGFDQYKLAAEYSLNDFVFLRGAYVLAWDADASEIRTKDEDFLFGPSFGAGINLSIGDTFDLMFDYAYRTTQLFDDNQWISLRLGF